MPENTNIKDVSNQKTWSFRSFFAGIKRFKWWVVGATVLGTICGFVGFKFIVNPITKELTATYTYNLAGTTEADGTARLIDGTLFNCYDIISYDNLKETRLSNLKKYEKVDINKIFNKSLIKVEKNIKYVDKTPEIEQINFTITSSASTFQNDEVGKSFLYDLINSPIKLSTKAIENYSVNYFIDEIKNDELFEKQIDLLKKQYSTINVAYYNLESEFGQSIVIDNKETKLYQAKNAFTTDNNNGTVLELDLLLNQMYSEYVYNYDHEKQSESVVIEEIKNLCRAYIETIKEYEKIKTIYENQLTQLISLSQITVAEDTNFTTKVLQISEHISDYSFMLNNLKKRLEYYGYDLEMNLLSTDSVVKHLMAPDAEYYNKIKSFKEKLADRLSKLDAQHKEITSISKFAYSAYKNKINILNSGYISVENEVSTIIGTGVGFLLSLVVSSLIVAAVYIYKKDDKAEK